MSSATAGSGLTWEDFLNLPDDPKYRHAELVDGELVLVNPPTWLHQRIVLRLASRLEAWTEAGAGRGAVLLDPAVQVRHNRGYQPDIAWYREEHADPMAGNPYLVGPPDLAVEVLSPSTRMVDFLRKPADYARVGVKELWLVEPDGPTVAVLRLPEEPADPPEFVLIDELKPPASLTSPLLPGFEARLTELTPR
jgi:Uma2 family endonuclease